MLFGVLINNDNDDITIEAKKKKKPVWNIDIAISRDSRIGKIEQKKITRYRDLQIELKQFWEKIYMALIVIGTWASA